MANVEVTTGAGVTAGAAVGAAAGSVVPILGTAIGGAVGAGIGGLAGLIGGGLANKGKKGDAQLLALDFEPTQPAVEKPALSPVVVPLLLLGAAIVLLGD